MKLTKRQKEILEFISGFIEDNGYSPSMEEIAEHFRFASLNAVFKHLEALESRGYLHRDSNRARSIQLFQEDTVLDINRFIQAQMFPDLLKGLFRCSLSHQQLGRIARGEVQHEKYDGGYAQEGGNHDKYASDDV